MTTNKQLSFCQQTIFPCTKATDKFKYRWTNPFIYLDIHVLNLRMHCLPDGHLAWVLAVVPRHGVHGVQDVPGLLPACQVIPTRHRLTLPSGLRLGMDSG